MSVKGWVEAQRHEGGIIKYLYDKVKALDYEMIYNNAQYTED